MRYAEARDRGGADAQAGREPGASSPVAIEGPDAMALLGSPNANALRRCRNGAFHFKPTYFSARSLKAISTPDFVKWVRELMTAFRCYFDRELKLVEP